MIVCLHGLGRTPADWDGVRGGLGDIAAPSLPRRPDDALAAADAAVEPGDVVVGHSMGGVVALRLALAKPLRALVVTGCFFRPARNGRSFAATAGDYAAHRVAFVRGLRRGGDGAPQPGSSRQALGQLARSALRPSRSDAALASVRAPVLVVHARDDHHVPVDFAIAAAVRNPGWTIRVLETGGHHAHVEEPDQWLAAVTPWLAENG